MDLRFPDAENALSFLPALSWAPQEGHEGPHGEREAGGRAGATPTPRGALRGGRCLGLGLPDKTAGRPVKFELQMNNEKVF